MHSKLKIRPEVVTERTDNVAEEFQNTTLRPILKLQHDLLIQLFKRYADKRKQDFKNMSIAEVSKFISNSLKSDHNFKSMLLGTIIGHFTIEEFEKYLEFENDLNKRIISMLIQRLESVLC